jgi:hypothetical protein
MTKVLIKDYRPSRDSNGNPCTGTKWKLQD